MRGHTFSSAPMHAPVHASFFKGGLVVNFPRWSDAVVTDPLQTTSDRPFEFAAMPSEHR